MWTTSLFCSVFLQELIFTNVRFDPYSVHIDSEELQKLKVAIHFHPRHPQPNIVNSSFCELVGTSRVIVKTTQPLF